MAKRKSAETQHSGQAFVQKLAKTLLEAGVSAEGADVETAFSGVVSELPDGPQKIKLQSNAQELAEALRQALTAGTEPAKLRGKRRRKPPTPEAGRPDTPPRSAAAQPDALAAEYAQPCALVSDAAYHRHVAHSALQQRGQHRTRHAVDEAEHGAEAAALLQARAPPAEPLLHQYGAGHDHLLADREYETCQEALDVAERLLGLSAALSRQAASNADPCSALVPVLQPLRAAVRLAAASEDASQKPPALEQAQRIAARLAAVLALRRRGSSAASCMPAAAWLRGGTTAQQDAEAVEAAPLPASLLLLRAELHLLQGGPALAAAAAARVVADVQLLLGGSPQQLVPLLLGAELPLAAQHDAAHAASLWRALFDAALQSGDQELGYLARLSVVRRAQKELAKAGAGRHATQALAKTRQLQPPASLLEWLKQQPPSATVQGALGAASGGRLRDVAAFFLDTTAEATLRAMMQLWQVAQHGAGECAGGSAAVTAADDPAAAGDELLFYVSTEGDQETGEFQGDADSEDGGFDLNALPDMSDGSSGEDASDDGSSDG